MLDWPAALVATATTAVTGLVAAVMQLEPVAAVAGSIAVAEWATLYHSYRR